MIQTSLRKLRLSSITLLATLCCCGKPVADESSTAPVNRSDRASLSDSKLSSEAADHGVLELLQANQECEQEVSHVRIGVFYIDNATGKAHLEGIEEGIEKHDLKERVCVKKYPYVNEREAVEKFRLATGRDTSEPEVDIILGPTESDVFVRMREEISAPASAPKVDESESKPDRGNEVPVPVVSGLVTTTVGNEPTGWFFRTNVDVTRRAETLYNYVNKYWVNSIAVMYANTEFGSRAEKAFAENLSPTQRKRYLPLIYDSPPRAKAQLDNILAARPEAVGFFGEREDIEQIYREQLERNGQWTSYHPIFFTLLDAVSVDSSVEDLIYVSVAPIKGNSDDEDVPDDVVALGHDTAVLTLNILSHIDEGADKADLRLQFRNRLATRLKRSERQPGTVKQMRFTNYENSSRLIVYERASGELKAVDLTRTIDPFAKFARRIVLIGSVWGWWPVFATAIIAVITVFVVYNELYHLFEGTKTSRTFWGVVSSKYFRRMAAPHFAAALGIYVILAETGEIRFDNLAMVAIVAFGPWALLKALLETPLGEKTGLKRYFQEWKSRIDNGLMKATFAGREAPVNVITYGNSQFAMRNALLDMYRNHPSPTEGIRLIQELEQKLQSENKYFERRRICARLLLQQTRGNWDELRAEGLVPYNCEEKDLVDPQKIVREAAKLCASEDKLTTIRNLVGVKLEGIKSENPQRVDELQKLLDAELKDTVSSEGQLNVYIRFLFVLFSFKVDQLQEIMSEDAYHKLLGFVESLKSSAATSQASPTAAEPAALPQPTTKRLVEWLGEAAALIAAKIGRVLHIQRVAPQQQPAEAGSEVPEATHPPEAADSQQGLPLGELESEMEEKEKQLG